MTLLIGIHWHCWLAIVGWHCSFCLLVGVVHFDCWLALFFLIVDWHWHCSLMFIGIVQWHCSCSLAGIVHNSPWGHLKNNNNIGAPGPPGAQFWVWPASSLSQSCCWLLSLTDTALFFSHHNCFSWFVKSLFIGIVDWHCSLTLLIGIVHWHCWCSFWLLIGIVHFDCWLALFILIVDWRCSLMFIGIVQQHCSLNWHCPQCPLRPFEAQQRHRWARSQEHRFFGRVARLEGVCVHGPFQVETFIILRDQGKFSFESLSIQSKASEIKLISHANIRPALGPLFSGGWRPNFSVCSDWIFTSTQWWGSMTQFVMLGLVQWDLVNAVSVVTRVNYYSSDSVTMVSVVITVQARQRWWAL